MFVKSRNRLSGTPVDPRPCRGGGGDDMVDFRKRTGVYLGLGGVSRLLCENQPGRTMGILKRIKRSLLARHGVFDISSDTGVLNSYAIRRARGEGGDARPETWKHYSPTTPTS